MIMLPLPKDKSDRINLITHELFHRAQPYLNLNPRNYDNNHLDKKEGRIYLRLELEALRKAMNSDNKSDIDNHLANALTFRKARYSIYPGADTLENLLELNEGLCEFTGVMMSGRNESEMRAHFSRHIDAFLQNQTFIRSFPYETTPIYGYLLSARKPGWNRDITLQTNLTNLFAKSFNLHIENNAIGRALKIQNGYNGEVIINEEAQREKKINALLQEYRIKFIEHPHFVLLFENMNISFDYTNIMPLDDKGVVYPSIRVKDNWGILEVKNGGLMSPDWKKITVSKPIDFGNGIVKGDGWMLELKEGYMIKEDEKTRNFYLSKKQQ